MIVFLSRVARVAVLSAGFSVVIPQFESSHETRSQRQTAELRVDSAQYTVRREGEMYRVAIGYVFTNGTNTPVSAHYCRTPNPPRLEKQTDDGRWIVAYSPIVLLCETIPPFRVAAGATYRGALDVAAAPPGANMMPKLEVPTIPGTYRLHWGLRSGPDPNDLSAPLVDVVSQTFRLVAP